MVRGLSRSRAALLVLGCGLIPSCSEVCSAQVTRSGTGYLFRMKHIKGARLDYRLVSEWPKPAKPVDPKRMEGPFSTTVLSVTRGVATIRVEAGPFRSDGVPLGNRPNTMDLQMDNRGRIVQGTPGLTQLNGIHLPDKPLKVGETFQATNVSVIGTSRITVKAKSTLKGFRTVGGRRAAEFKLKISSEGLAPISGTGTQLVDMADGQMISARIEQKATASIQGKTVVVPNIITISLVRRK